MERRKLSTIFLGRVKSDEHWNRFKSLVGKAERKGGAHYYYGLFRAHRYHLELNLTEPNRTLVRLCLLLVQYILTVRFGWLGKRA